MRFNKQELLTLAAQSSHKYEKEGVLVLREKSDSFFRRTESERKSETKVKAKRDSFSCIGPNGQACTERWFRLAGNLLFYLKTRDHWSEPVGVIVLENCTVKVDPRLSTQNHQGYHFVIDFVSGGYHLLAALTESDRATWMASLKIASFASIRARMNSLKVQIQTRLALSRPTQSSLSLPGGVENDSSTMYSSSRKDRTPDTPIKACGYVKDLSEAPLFEFSFACDNLPADSHGRLPNAKVVIHVRNSRHQEWIKYSSTEIVEKLSNPVFLTTVSFRESDGIHEKAHVRLTVYDVRERTTQTQTVVGHLVINLSTFKRVQRIRLGLIPPTSFQDSRLVNSAGFITVYAWNPEREERSSTESTPCRATATPEYASGGFFAHRRTQSLPPRLGSKLKIPLQNNFETLFSNPFMQTYRFHSGLGGDIFVHEIMAESKLSFLFPQQLLSTWIAEEKELLQEMIGLGELREPWHSRQVQILERHLWLINVYTQARQNLVNHKGMDFKLSSTKASTTYEFVPLNLHLQRIWVQNESLHKCGFHDNITVGAFTAHAQRFDDGGLVKLLHGLQQFGVSKGVHSSWYATNKVNMMYDSVQNIKRLRKEIVERMQIIMKLARERKTVGLHRFVEDIYQRCQLLLSICDQTMIEEAFSFFERHKLTFPTSTSLDFDKLTNSNCEDVTRFIDEGVDTPNSPMRSAVELFKKRTEATNIFDKNSEDKTPDSGLGVEEIVKSFLDSPSSNYYRPTEEPEPWDLTQLNIEASVISLNSKVKAMCGVGANIDSHMLRPISRAHSFKVNCISTSETNGSSLKMMDSWRKSLRDELPASKEKGGRTLSLFSPKLKLAPPLSLPMRTPIPSDVNQTTSESTVAPEMSGISDWSEELRASVKKLRLAMDGLLKTSRLAHGIFRLQENADKSKLTYTLKYRRDICFSQALTSLVTGLMLRLWCRKPDPTFLFVIMRLGPLINFAGLLTYQGSEAEMISDMIVAIEDLKTVEFWLVPHETKNNGPGEDETSSSNNTSSSSSSSCPVPKVYGCRTNLKVLLPVPETLFAMLPLDSTRNTSFLVTPVYFNVGINDKATLAERFGNIGPMEKSNWDNFNRLSDYYRQFNKLVLPVEFSSKRHHTPEPDIGSMITELEVQLSSKKKKNVDIVHLSSQISRRMMGLRFTSCKSGKDRTSMGATVEQCQILSQEYDLAEYEFPRALEAMKSEGCRRENTLKNIGKRKYAFNSLQVYALPTLYRPPPGTFGSAQS